MKIISLILYNLMKVHPLHSLIVHFPIFKSRCINCHGGQKTEEDLNLTSYEMLMAGSKNGPVIIPGDIVNSLLAKALIEREMPKRGPKLSPDQAQLIIDWIKAGAQDN